MNSHPRLRYLVVGACTTVLIALAGCGKSHDPEPPPNNTQFEADTVPAASEAVDELTWNLPGGEPSTLDPVAIYGGGDLLVDANLCESLLSLAPSGDVEPGLASSIDQPDDTTYVVHLREGVNFSDGTPMTARDVVFSLDRIRDPDSGSYWGFFAQAVSEVTATDDSTVTIRLSRPDAIFYSMLATPMAQVVQEAYVDEAGSKYGSPKGGVMCTGPYVLDEWNPGKDIVLSANDGWWRGDEVPQLSRTARFTFLTDDATVTSALTNGDIDGSFNIPRTTMSTLRDASDGSVYSGPSTNQLVLIPTQLQEGSTSVLADPKLREAFAKSIDYAGILSSILGDVASPLRAAMPPGGWGYAESAYSAAYDELADPVRDLDAAKAIVEQSGISDPTITMAVPADIPEYVTLGETIQSNAEDAGFEVDLQPMPSADFNALFGDAGARAKIDVFLADWYADIPDPTELYVQFGISGGAADFGGYVNTEAGQLLEQARRTIDDDQRADLTIKAQKILTDDLVWIPLAYPLQTLYLQDDLGGATAAFPFVMYSPWLPYIGGR